MPPINTVPLLVKLSNGSNGFGLCFWFSVTVKRGSIFANPVGSFTLHSACALNLRNDTAVLKFVAAGSRVYTCHIERLSNVFWRRVLFSEI